MVSTKQSPLRVERLEDRTLPSANIVFEWTNLLLDVSGPFDADGSGPLAPRNQGNQVTARNLAMLEAAIYDAVNAINPTYTAYHVDARAFPGASTASDEAAAAQAAYDVASQLYTRTAACNYPQVAEAGARGSFPAGNPG